MNQSELCNSCPLAARIGGPCPVQPGWHAKPLKYLFIGEAPGKEEEQQGQPFIGPSGTLLRKKIVDAGIDLDECAFTNAVMCTPREGNRKNLPISTPTAEDALHCVPHAISLVRRYRPKVVIVVGGVAASTVIRQKSIKITTQRGRWSKMAVGMRERYMAFRTWLEDAKLGPDVDDISYSAWDDEDTQIVQIDVAKEQHGYEESWVDTPVMPIVHPAFALRTGVDGRWSESIYFDLQKAMNEVEGTAETTRNLDYRWIYTLDQLREWASDTISRYKNGKFPHIAWDIETSEEASSEGYKIGLATLDPKVRILTMQFCYKRGSAVAIMLNHARSQFNTTSAMMEVRALLKEVLETVPVIGQNLQFDVKATRSRLGIHDIKVVGDTMLMDHWLQAGKGLFSNLDDMGARYLGTGKHKSHAKEWREKFPGGTFEEMPTDLEKPYAGFEEENISLGYAAGDADVTLGVYDSIRALIEQEGRWQEHYDIMYGQHEVWQVVCDTEYSGMPVERSILDALNVEYPKRIDKCLVELHNNGYIRAYVDKKRVAANQKSADHNASIKAGSRKRSKKIYDLNEWLQVRKNWFNPNSVKQVLELWMGTMHLPFAQFADTSLKDLEFSETKPGIPKTSAHNRKVLTTALEEWTEANRQKGDEQSAQHWAMMAEVVALHSKYKTLTKLYGTYVKGIYPLIIDKPEPDQEWDPNKRCFELYRPFADFPRPWSIHPSYKLNGTETGRLSSADPNGQNFPKWEVEQRVQDPAGNVKSCYVSHWRGKGGLIVQPDYSQIEVRVMVMMCGDERLGAAINAGKDIHTFAASLVHGIPEEKVTKDIRGPVKSITFGIIYGQSVSSMSQLLKIPVHEGQKIQDKFFQEMPKVKDFMELQHDFVKEHGYVYTLLGRRRWLPHYQSDREAEKSKALRDSVNTPIQSIASDLCATAFGRSWSMIKAAGIEAVPYSIIHDSQGFDASPGRFFDIIELQYYQMAIVPQIIWPWITVKPEADFEIAPGWGRDVGAKLFFDENEQLDHNRIGLAGPVHDVDLVCSEIHAGGQDYEVLADGPHPKEEEAAKGMWYRELNVDRPDPICLLQGKKLFIRGQEQGITAS